MSELSLAQQFELIHSRMQYSDKLLLTNSEKPMLVFQFFNDRNQKSIRYVYVQKSDNHLRVVAPFGMFLTVHKDLRALKKFSCYRETFQLIWKDD